MLKRLWLTLCFCLATACALAATPSVLQLTSTTTAYTAGQFISNNSNGTNITVPFFNLQGESAANQILIQRGHLYTNDTTANSWNGHTVLLDFWSIPPTFTSGNGDRSTFSPNTGSATHYGQFTCTFSTIYGDGAQADCVVTIGTVMTIPAGNVTPVYWTAVSSDGSGTTGASKTFSFIPETVN